MSKSTHKVLAVSKNGQLLQYLKLSEARYLSQICQDHDLEEITVKTTYMSDSQYKMTFV